MRLRVLDGALIVTGLAMFAYQMFSTQYLFLGSYEHQAVHLGFVFALLFLHQARQAKTRFGMGLNLAYFPDDTPYLATSIAAHTGHRPDNLAVLEVLASAFDLYYRQWQQFGFSVIVRKWRQQAHNLGREIIVRLEKSELSGIFEDIDDAGALILCSEDGERHIVSAGDVFFR